jgi:hypothetical protein
MHPSATPRYFVVHSLVWIGLSTGLGYQHAQENNPSAAVVDTQPSGQQAEGAVVNLDLPTVAEASTLRLPMVLKLKLFYDV